jgi:hypothetical protein
MALSQTGFVGTIPVGDVAREIANNAHLFGEYPQRADAPGSPHAEMSDIWARYGDIAPMLESGDFSGLADEHDSIWLKDLPAVKRVCMDVMTLVDGERLGGVLITKLPVGGRIKPHSDSGWHASYYDKFFVPIENEEGAVFGFEDRDVDPSPGEVWQFNNSRAHWVNNDSNADRIAMIVCVKTDKDFYERI